MERWNAYIEELYNRLEQPTKIEFDREESVAEDDLGRDVPNDEAEESI